MRPIPPAVIRGTLVSSLMIVCLAAAGCASDDRPSRGGKGRPPRTQTLPTMTGRENFFAGRITADVRIGALAGFDRNGDGEDGGHRQRRSRHGGGGFGMGGGPGGEGGPRARPDGDDSRPQPDLHRDMAVNIPPVAIYLRLTNDGSTPAELEIVDFLSPLGNFVVNPSRLKLEPGQSLEVEPMASRLAGDVTAEEVTLALRLENADETKKVTLQPEAATKPAATP